MAADFKHVGTFGALTVDEALLYVAPIEGLTRLPVLYEGLEDHRFPAGNDWAVRGAPADAIGMLPRLHGREHALQLLQLGIYYAFEPETNKGAADSAWQYLQQAYREVRQQQLPVPVLLVTQRMLMKVALKQYDFNTADSLFQQQVSLALPARNYAAMGAACYYRGYFVPLPAGRLQERAQMYARAVDYYTLAGRKEQRLEAMVALAYHQNIIEQQEASEALIPHILRGMDSLGFRYQHYMTDLQAYIYTTQQRNKLEAQATFRSMASAKATGDTMATPVLLIRMGRANADLGRFEESYQAHLEAINLFSHRHDPGFYSCLPILATAFTEPGKVDTGITLINRAVNISPPQNLTDTFRYNTTMAILYGQKKDFKRSLAYLQTAISLVDRVKALGLFYLLPDLFYDAGYIYYNAGDYPRATYYLERVTAIHAPAILTTEQIGRAHSRLFDIYRSEKKLDLAIYHLQRYKQIEDSINDVRRYRDATELAVQYETARKEESIKTLEATSKLQQSELKRVSLIRNIILGSAMAALLLALYLYRLYKAKQSRTRLLEKQQVQIREQNEQLSQLIGEKDELLQTKELLVREIHHRVKNNLQILMSLLYTQAAFLKGNDAQRAILDSHSRMQAISIVHNQLYRTEGMTIMHMREYILSLTNFLRESFAKGGRTFFDVQVEEILLDISQAIPVGLIVNEAVTNAIKHAFDGSRWGRIAITFRQLTPRQLVLAVADDGKGLPADFDLERSDSMGMHLIKVLSQQLGGQLQIAHQKGLKIEVLFSPVDI